MIIPKICNFVHRELRAEYFLQYFLKMLQIIPYNFFQIISASQELILERAKRDFLESDDVGLSNEDEPSRVESEDPSPEAVKQMFNDPYWKEEWYMVSWNLSIFSAC